MSDTGTSCDICSQPNITKFIYYTVCSHHICSSCYESIYDNILEKKCRICSTEGQAIIFYIGASADELNEFITALVAKN